MVKLMVGIVGIGLLLMTGCVTGEGNSQELPIPNIELIYQKALEEPFEAAGEKIEDPEIREFYYRLMDEIFKED